MILRRTVNYKGVAKKKKVGNMEVDYNDQLLKDNKHPVQELQPYYKEERRDDYRSNGKYDRTEEYDDNIVENQGSRNDHYLMKPAKFQHTSEGEIIESVS